jgi:hypothetical protein
MKKLDKLKKPSLFKLKKPGILPKLKNLGR